MLWTIWYNFGEFVIFLEEGGGRLIVLLSYYFVSVDISVVEFQDESRGLANYKKN